MLRALTFSLVLGLAPGLALAGPDYSAEDIIKHFANLSADRPAGAAVTGSPTRSVFIGTEGYGDKDAPLSIPSTGGHNPITAEQSEAPAVAAAKPAPNARRQEYDLLITFELGSDKLTGRAQQNLNEFARALGDPALAGLRFLVEGHTDARGGAAFNQELSESRAASVVRYLTARGIPANRLQSRGHGETRPLVGDPYAPQNRRVETRIIR